MNTNSYFTVELLTSGTLGFQQPSGNGTPITVYYWINKDPNAAKDNYDGSITTSSTLQTISGLVVGDKVKFYRAETTALCGSESDNWNNRVNGTAQYKFSGNIASLIGFNETLPEHCFRRFFYNCSVVDASELELPWLTLSNECYMGMFYQCSKLVYTPYLPATTLGENCYRVMFRQCTSLKNIASMACKNLVWVSHYCMYQLCTGLEKVTIPKFDTYYNQALAFFLNGCTGLKELIIECPETLSTQHMFYYLATGCTSLEKVTCLAKNSTANCTQNWLASAPATGTFVKHPDATFWPEGDNGIPTGWTVKNMTPQVQSLDFNDVNAVKVKGDINITTIYGQNNVLLWSAI